MLELEHEKELELEQEQEQELERVQEEGLGRCLEGLGQELHVPELHVLEQEQQQLPLHSLRWAQQKMISVGMKLHSPTCAHLPQTPLQ